MTSGWNLWVRVWLKCIGVVSGCCCKEVYRYPHNNYYFFLLHLVVLALFWQQHPYFFVHFKKCFFRSCLCYFCAIYSKRCSHPMYILYA